MLSSNMQKAYICCITMVAILFCSCNRSHRQQNVDTVPDIKKPLTTFYDSPDTVAAFTTWAATFNATTSEGSFNGSIRIHYDSIVWINITKLIEIGRLKLTNDSVSAYTRLLNKYIDCRVNELSSFMNMQITFPTIQNILIGKGSNTSSFLVDYDNFDTINGIEFPRELDLTINDKRFYRTVQIKYNKIILDAEQTYPLTIPTSAQNLLPNNTQ